MGYIQILRHIIFALFTLSFIACSAYKHVPDGEILYAGMRETIYEDSAIGSAPTLYEEINAAIEYAPNASFLGSAYIQTPFSTKLWLYNMLDDKQNGFAKWIKKMFAEKPIYISSVNPDMRKSLVSTLLRENGYFSAKVSAKTIVDPKGKKKARLQYTIRFNQPYILDSINFGDNPEKRINALYEQLASTDSLSLLSKGNNFSVVNLEEERIRAANTLRDTGYFFFKPSNISFKVDTAASRFVDNIKPGSVWIKREIDLQLAPEVSTRWHIGKIETKIEGGKIRPEILEAMKTFKQGDVYKQSKHNQTLQRMQHLDVFSFSNIQYTLRPDTGKISDTSSNDSLDVMISATLDMPITTEFELNLSGKSNRKIGPGAKIDVSRKNLFGGGEVLKISGNALYEWPIGNRTQQNDQHNDSYEFGLSAELDIPKLLLIPTKHKHSFDDISADGTINRQETKIRLRSTLLQLSSYFEMISSEIKIGFTHTKGNFTHTYTPLQLYYNNLLSLTDEFNDVIEDHPSMIPLFRDEMIPAAGYSFSTETQFGKHPLLKHKLMFDAEVSTAGNLVSAAYMIAGKDFFMENKKLLGNPYAQFAKLSLQTRYHHSLNPDHTLAFRIKTAAIYSYGNASLTPYAEQLYIGGANSIRAFTMRSIGPGSYIPEGSDLDYLMQTGDFLFEANTEYRARLFKNWHGAVFLDAGNVWLLSDAESELKPGGQLGKGNFLEQITLATGWGIRYHLPFLIFRFDMGIALHLPYDTGKKGYFNVNNYRDAIGFHLAFGLPF